MVEPSLFHEMSKCAALNGNDTVLDVGAGLGFLTAFLASICGRVLAVETDRRLIGVLHAQLEDLRNVELIKGSVLKAQIPQFNKVMAIPPYNISSQLITWIFDRKPECAVLILQKEFANRLVAPVGDENYGWLTVLTYYHSECELLNDIPRSIFFPQPEVDSILVRLTQKQPKQFMLKNEALFRTLLRSLFAQRNRKVRNAVLPFLEGIRKTTTKEANRLANAIPNHNKRVRELAPEDFGELANAFAD